MREDFLTLYNDPGEDYGWALGCGTLLLARGTEKMWPMLDAIEVALTRPEGAYDYIRDPGNLRNGVDESLLDLPIKRIVVEDWRLYPDKMKGLKWDKCRTARAIGVVTWLARKHGAEIHFQPASIKDAAQSAGAEELYDRPLRPNRHQNDAIQHFTFFTHTVLIAAMDPEERYRILNIPNNAQEGGDDD